MAFDEDKETYTRLAMDRALALGNSGCPNPADGRRRLHTKVCNYGTDEAIPVDVVGSGFSGTKLSAGSVQVDATANIDTTIGTITLATDTKYGFLDIVASATRLCVWRVVWNDDGAETDLIPGGILTGAGNIWFKGLFENVEFTSGAAGTQELKLIGNVDKSTDLRGTIFIRTV